MTGHGDAHEQNAVTELRFELSDPAYPFVGASDVEGCRFDLEQIIPRSDGRYAEFFNVSNAEPDRILALVERHDSVEPHFLENHANGGLFEFSVSGNCPAVSLSELGALPRVATSEDGVGRIVAELPSRHDPATVVESFLDDYPDAEFLGKRGKECVTSLFGSETFDGAVRERLTERQHEVLEAAFAAGYYDWPRDATGQEVAKTLEITSATFSQHIHAAERKLLSILFEENAPESNVTETR